ncbi:MAG: glycosyltransferase family 4 protein [Acidobacteriota bacterium]|nr:glycosyltransferase family 4 protein [Acidobacteriota bacterium]
MRILVNEFCGHPFGMDLSRELARRGHTVLHTYFADNTSTPKGSDSAAENVPDLTIKGLHIQRAFVKHGLLSRRAADVEYGRAVASEVRRFRPDVVLSGDMPLDGQRILRDAARGANARFVFWLQDVYSTAVRYVLRRKAPLLAGLAGWYYERVEKDLLRKSDAVVCIAPAFAEQLARWKISGPHVSVIPNWAPVHAIVPTPKDNAWAREMGVADRFCFLYSGTLGMKHRPELLLALAKKLEARGDARLVVVAGGAGADWLAERAHAVSRDALTLLPFQPYERVPEVLGAADVLIALLDAEAGSFAVPSKTLAYLCAGRPVMIAAQQDNEAARLVARAKAGIVVPPDGEEHTIEAAMRLMDDPALRAEFGKNARGYAEESFAIDAIANRFLSVFGDGAESDAGAKNPARADSPAAARTTLDA